MASAPHLSPRCAHRYVASAARASQCGWCGSVSKDPTLGLCMSQSQRDSSPSLCYAYDPLFRVSPNGCDANGDSFAAVALGLGVFYAVTLLSSCALAYVVKSRRNGSCSQIACWFAIGCVFSVMAWYMLQCWGPKPRNHGQHSQAQSHAALAPEFSLGSAPPASDSVEAAALYPPFQQQQQQQFNAQQPTLYLPNFRPPPYNPQAAPAFAAQASQGPGRQ